MAEPKLASTMALFDENKFRASWAQRERMKLERLRNNNPLPRNKTADEIMAEGGGEKALRLILAQNLPVNDTESSELSDVVSFPNSELAIAESEASSEEASEQPGASDAEDERESEPDDHLGLTHPVERENWRSIRGLFTSKRFPPPQSGPLKALLRQPRKREIELRTTQKFSIFWPKDAYLLIPQLVSEEAPSPCDRCEKGFGMFEGCVILSQEVANVLQSGVCSCVNCGWKSAHHRNCNLEQILLKNTKAQGRAKTKPVPAKPSHAVDHEVASTGDELSPLRTRRSGRLLTSNLARDDEQMSIIGSHKRTPRKVALPCPPSVKSVDAEASVVETANAADKVETRAMSHSTEVDDRFTLSIEVVPTGSAVRFEPDLNNLRICTLASGKVVVEMQGEPAFTMGLHGVFNIMPGTTCEVSNTSGIDAVLRISILRLGK